MFGNKKLIGLALVSFILIAAAVNIAARKTFFDMQKPAGSVEGKLKIETLEKGSGSRMVQPGDKIKVDYIGALEDGTTFDSSISKKEPYSIEIGTGKVIKGWEKGVIGMKVGEKRKLTIAPELAYGSIGTGIIPANATVIFEIDLLEIK